MKKGIIVLLIAVLVSGFAFAGFSGYAGIQLNADLDAQAYGFKNPGKAEFTFEFATDTKAITGEGIYAELAASAKAIVDKLNGGQGSEDKRVVGVYNTFDENSTKYGLGLVISIDTAKIVGDGWYVDILGAKKAYDYAKAAVATAYQDEDKNAFDIQKKDGLLSKWKESASSYKVAFKKADGVTFGYAGFTASVGFNKTKADGTSFSATLETPEFAFSDDAVKVQAAAEASHVGNSGVTNVGASAKTNIAIQDVKLGVAADFGLEGIGDKAIFNMDARVDFTYNFVAVNVYTYIGPNGILYGGGETTKATELYKDFYLEAKAVFDLNAFELPLKVTAKAKNITNTTDVGIGLGLAVDFAKDAITAGAGFDINTKNADWSAYAKGKYAFEKFTAGAGLLIENNGKEISGVKAGVFAESDKLVQNATFGLSYGLAQNKVMEDGAYAAVDKKKYNNNFVSDPVKAGLISAYGIIKF